MEFMRRNIGQKEIAGKDQNNPFILALFEHTSYKADTDETPWCAAAVCAALEESGFKSTGSVAAVSYLDYGVACELKQGCVVVLRRKDGGHHVTFCEKVLPGKFFQGLGGNQSDEITISTYMQSSIVAKRWPVE